MNTYRYTPEKIVEEKLSFSIPLNQRLFSWGEEQVKGLLYDLKNHFDHDDGTPYYLGMLSCIKSGNHYDLIDGQQRLTSLTLLLLYLRKRISEKGLAHNTVDGMIYSEAFGKKSFNINVEEREEGHCKYC